jgi:peptide/nickel transport system ATP-binding protein
MSALNPVLRIGVQMREALPQGLSKAKARERLLELLALVDLTGADKILKSYPCELSGGMAQRICIAMAMAAEPALLVADEPTTALDVVAQKRVMDLLEGICRKTGVAVLLITHNLGLVAGYAESVSVMYAGLIVEQGDVKDVLAHPAHPYTSALMAAVPGLDGGGVETLATIPGRVPPATAWGIGCVFAPRCPLAMPICREQLPELKPVSGTHCAACFACEFNKVESHRATTNATRG